MKGESKPTYYKYRSLENLERFIDVILTERLYGAVYSELNDPMEGRFNRNGLDKKYLEGIYKTLKRTRICSLQKKGESQKFPDDFLMWSHYADGHMGCCLEVELTNGRNNSKNGWEVLDVKYQEELPNVTVGGVANAIKKIVSVKHLLWESENETRAIRIYKEGKIKENSAYYAVKVLSVYLGRKIPSEKCKFYRSVIKALNSEIEVYKIKDGSSSGYYPGLDYELVKE